MGQSSSKYHEPSSSTSQASNNAVAGASTDPQPSAHNEVGAHTPDASGSRRSSVRKSILKMVKPSSIRNRLSSDPSTPQDTKRSWRKSRRWSKAPLDATPALEPSDTLPIASCASTTSLGAGPSNTPSLPSDKGKQRDIIPSVEDDESTFEPNAVFTAEAAQPSVAPLSPHQPSADSSPIEQPPIILLNSESVTSDAPSMRVVDSDSPSIQGPSSTTYNREREENPPVETDTSPSSHSISPSEPHQASAEPRQFPPPGTLVVVQGIVHTTDVSRSGSTQIPVANSQSEIPAASASSRPPSTNDSTSETRARNRLSTLLRRPASRPPSSAGPVTFLETDSLPPPPPSISQPLSENSQVRSPSPALGEPVDPLQDEPSSRPSTPPPPTLTSENRAPAISSSSIDVLGTLLSVAAAATAASLLTGSSEPILSSGLASPNPPPSSSTEPMFTPPSSTSLPAYHRPHTPIPTNIMPDISAAGRAERMRQAWGTIRERLGLRPSASPIPGGQPRSNLQQDENENTTSTRQDGDPNAYGPADTREIMLAEMARAFNIGLGLNGLGGLASPTNATQSGQSANGVSEEPTMSSDQDDSSSAPAGPSNDSEPSSGSGNTGITLPPEGSFERFLVDLQVDLRAALTQTEDDTTSVPGLSNTRPQAQESPEVTPSAAVSEQASGSDTPIQSGPSDVLDLENLDAREGRQFETSQSTDDLDGDIPSLQAVSDSESELEDDEAELHSGEPGFVNAETQNMPTNEQDQPNSGTNRIDASGRINWWRLYRFPPIPSRLDNVGLRPPFSPTSTTMNSTSSATSSEATLTPGRFAASGTHSQSDSSPLSNSASSSIPTPNTAGEIPPAAQIPMHAVVPVIVVGLQSVNQDWRPDIPSQPDDGIDIFGQTPSDEMHAPNAPHERVDDDELDGWGGQQQDSAGLDSARGRGRSRGWHSRAANAIRNLRPGRRSAGSNAGLPTPLIAPGSRTFLIYVIGGYYPPDHSIVTGGPNILDSFEALLELADLLGQVKPPTVSKDDIDKSGLEIIKASELVQHEKDGKVSSNCLDRCLICLDDYEPEDPIRVMTCRHAFHRNCVDEWLQKGRNNCPACRSTGVATDTRSTMPMPT